MSWLLLSIHSFNFNKFVIIWITLIYHFVWPSFCVIGLHAHQYILLIYRTMLWSFFTLKSVGQNLFTVFWVNYCPIIKPWFPTHHYKVVHVLSPHSEVCSVYLKSDCVSYNFVKFLYSSALTKDFVLGGQSGIFAGSRGSSEFFSLISS